MIKLIKRFFCWVGWHSWKYDITGVSGPNFANGRCRWCGYEGLVDTQGHLF